MNTKSVSIRRARREDVAAIVALLADDHLGRARERVEDPLPATYYEAFARYRVGTLDQLRQALKTLDANTSRVEYMSRKSDVPALRGFRWIWRATHT